MLLTSCYNLHLANSLVSFIHFCIPKQIFIFSNEEYFGSDFNAQIDWSEPQLVEVRISKKNTYTTDDARQLSIGQRKCIFSDEVKLNYFPDAYTFSSCMKQCRMNKAIKLCKCNPPFYKPIGGISRTASVIWFHVPSVSYSQCAHVHGQGLRLPRWVQDEHHQHQGLSAVWAQLLEDGLQHW